MGQTKKNIYVLDIGSHKISCCIGFTDQNGKIDILSYYPVLSNSFKNGIISDLNQLSKDIGNAIQSAEELAEEQIEHVLVSFSGALSKSAYLHIEENLYGNVITKEYISKLLTKAYHEKINEKEDIMHFLPINFSINGKNGIKEPVGQYADILGIDVHFVKVNRIFKKNLEAAVIKNRLKVIGFCNSNYASGLGVLTSDEKEMGSCVIDIGAGSTDISMFKGGDWLHSFSIIGGGLDISGKIKSNLKCSFATAEKLKNLHGSINDFNVKGYIEYREEGVFDKTFLQQYDKKDFKNLIKSEVEVILKRCKERLDDNFYFSHANKVIVLTGGLALTEGIKELAEEIFNIPVRIGNLQNIVNMPVSYNNSMSACTSGLLHYYAGGNFDKEHEIESVNKMVNMKKFLKRLKENL